MTSEKRIRCRVYSQRRRAEEIKILCCWKCFKRGVAEGGEQQGMLPLKGRLGIVG